MLLCQQVVATGSGSDWVAIGALVVAVLSLGFSALRWRLDGRADRARDQRIADRDRTVAELQSAQAETLAGIERATAAGIDPAAAHALGAAISVDVLDLGRYEYSIRVKNLGPGGALVQKLTMRFGDQDFEPLEIPGGTQELLPGEVFDARFHCASTGDTLVEVAVHYVDGRVERGNEVRERVRSFTLTV